METQEVKKEETKKFGFGGKVLAGLLILIAMSVVFAGVVSYLSNTATATVSVDSPMTVQFAEVDFAGDLTEPNIITVVDAGTYVDTAPLTGITGFDTIDMGVKVTNDSEVTIASKTMLVTVSNDLGNVDLGDITSLQFFDSGASPGMPSRVWQELTTIPGIGVDNGSTVTYSIPINSLAPGTTYKYPVTVTFGLVTPANYTITATLMN